MIWPPEYQSFGARAVFLFRKMCPQRKPRLAQHPSPGDQRTGERLPPSSAGVGGNDSASPNHSNKCEVLQELCKAASPRILSVVFKVTLSEAFCFGLFHVRLCAMFHLNKWFLQISLCPSSTGLLSASHTGQAWAPFRALAQCLLFSLPRMLLSPFSVWFSPSWQSFCGLSVTFLERLFLIIPGVFFFWALTTILNDFVYLFASLFTIHLPQ